MNDLIKTMYYKIENKESKLYKTFVDLRQEEKGMDERNKVAIKEKVALEYRLFLGHSGQQNFSRVREYSGFQFIEPEKVDPKLWKPHKEHSDFFVPNRRTKAGREMNDFLLNGLERSFYGRVFDILEIPIPSGKFSIPYVEKINETLLLYIGDIRIDNEDVIEITSKEWEQIFQAVNTIKI